MSRNRIQVLGVCAVLMLLVGSAALAQATTVEVKQGIVLSVDGNVLTYRGTEGVKRVTVPAGFHFNMNGRDLTLGDLRPGMKLTAVIKTTETPIQMTETEVREGTVLHVSGVGGTVIVRTQDGKIEKFTTKELKNRGVIFHNNGKLVNIEDLHEGQKYSATIVTELPPTIMTESEYKVYAAQAPPRRPVRQAAARPAPKPAPMPVSMPHTGSPLSTLGLTGLALIFMGAGLTVVRRFFLA